MYTFSDSQRTACLPRIAPAACLPPAEDGEPIDVVFDNDGGDADEDLRATPTDQILINKYDEEHQLPAKIQVSAVSTPHTHAIVKPMAGASPCAGFFRLFRPFCKPHCKCAPLFCVFQTSYLFFLLLPSSSPSFFPPLTPPARFPCICRRCRNGSAKRYCETDRLGRRQARTPKVQSL